MCNTFDEVKFIKGLKQLNAQVPNQYNDKVAKTFIREVILNCGFDKQEVFQYFRTLIYSHLGICGNFDVEGWEKIYEHFIKNPRYPRTGKMLQDRPHTLSTSGEYELYFINTVETSGLNAESIITEIIIDSLGWLRLLDTFLDMADEMGIVVEEPKLKERKKSKSKTSRKSEDEFSAPHTSVSEVCADVVPPKVEEAAVHTKKSKRGYSIPVCQYKKIAVFDTIDIAAATTGIEVDTIISGIENQPMGTVNHIWKYINKSKTKVAQYEYLHTYKNQNDINSQSLKVCVKKISHTNVAPKLKEWKQVSKEEFVWIKVTA